VGILNDRVAWTATVIGLLFSVAVPIAAAQSSPTEYAVKAAFVYNFAKFVEWPGSAFGESSEPLVNGVLGEDPFGPLLRRAVVGKQAGGHPIEVRHFASVESITLCHILFVGRSDEKTMRAVEKALDGDAVLTVGESDRFLESGGMINLRLDGKKVRFEINAGAARGVGLRISSQLLKLAIRVLGAAAAG